jgi:hypothetical protein
MCAGAVNGLIGGPKGGSRRGSIELLGGQRSCPGFDTCWLTGNPGYAVDCLLNDRCFPAVLARDHAEWSGQRSCGECAEIDDDGGFDLLLESWSFFVALDSEGDLLKGPEVGVGDG